MRDPRARSSASKWNVPRVHLERPESRRVLGDFRTVCRAVDPTENSRRRIPSRALPRPTECRMIENGLLRDYISDSLRVFIFLLSSWHDGFSFSLSLSPHHRRGFSRARDVELRPRRLALLPSLSCRRRATRVEARGSDTRMRYDGCATPWP